MKLGISSYALTWAIGVKGYEPPLKPLTAVGLVKLAHELGLHLVQIACNVPLHEFTNGQLHELKQAADELEVTLEIGARGTNPARMLQYLELANFLGSNIVRTLITDPDISRGETDIRRILPFYEANNIMIGIENHGLHTTTQLADLFKRINNPLVGCCLDTVNSFGALEGPDLVIERLAPYLVNLHIKDFTIDRLDHQMGFVITGAPAGQGRLDINKLVEVMKFYNKRPSVILELWPPYKNSVEETVALEREWLLQSLDFLKHVLNITL